MANSEIVVADKKNKGLDDHSLQMRFLRERAPQGTDSEDWSGTGNYTGGCPTPFWSWHVRRISLPAQMSAQFSWSSSLIKPSEINSLMEAELFHLELGAGAKPFALSLAPSVSGANIGDGLLIVH